MNIISAKKSGYLKTNIPQTGHLSLGDGLIGFLSPAQTGKNSVSVSVSVSTKESSVSDSVGVSLRQKGVQYFIKVRPLASGISAHNRENGLTFDSSVFVLN